MHTKLQPRAVEIDRLRHFPEEEEVDVIRCRDCGSTYPVAEGPAMLYSLKCPCLHCGGECELAVVEEPLTASPVLAARA
jgi:hypothetical protein